MLYGSASADIKHCNLGNVTGRVNSSYAGAVDGIPFSLGLKSGYSDCTFFDEF